NMHMHTPYSDGEKYHAAIAEDAIAAGLDFIIVTDHNIWVDGVEGYYENGNGRVLLLSGEEVHNPRRRPQASHFLAYGAERELAPFSADPQKLIDETIAAGGIGFLAHPHEGDSEPLLDISNLGWHDWEIENFTGLEIWNYMSSFANVLKKEVRQLPVKNKFIAKLKALQMALQPQKYIVGPELETLALWDELLAQGKRVTAVGNSDAHGTPMSMGPIKRIIYPYEFLFRAVNTHVLTPKPLNGDVTHDKQMILDALGKGRSWVGYDMAHDTKGFRFSGQGVNKGIVGDKIQLDAGATLQVKTPIRANIRLIRHGEVAAQIENETHLTHIPVEEGAYRIECAIPYEGQERGWIYSNPIYLW
ncbi:MAG: CehA/McbA family metallohydrolase, partial [Chloroflexi bacterium]|nr:CehA/McbA family metallohydrolase [Chloroflexota bacterium]